MAKLQPKKSIENIDTTETVNEVTNNEPINNQKVVQNTNPSMNAILERLENLEKENAKLRSTGDIFKNAKERYSGPREYSYKLWSGVPVLSYISKPKDPSRDLVYENEKGIYVSNHILVLSLANGKEIDVDVNEFNKSFSRSEKMRCEVLSDGQNVLGYKFTNSQYGEFIVSPNIIN